ncbi:MAG: 4Fe-4S binding protein [Candidatus Omnitrophica bacterium]|nr:4Fe-4S binding protein [Candidatus Omnitrophota bacterium]
MTTKRIVLHFPKELVDQPIVFRLSRDFDLEFNILKASVTPQVEGLMVLELKGTEENIKRGFDYLRNVGVRIQPLSQDISWNDKKCTHCGVCIPLCPVGALVMDAQTRRVSFLEDKCIACELCIKVCPIRAIEVHF